MLTIAQLAPLKSRDPYLYEVLTKMIQHINVWQQQTGVAPTGNLAAPPAPGAISVVAQNGWYDVAITDKGAVQPGIGYFVEFDTSPNFTNAHTEYLGPSRNKHLGLGNQKLYFRAFSMYLGSLERSSHVVYGGSSPVAVVGGGASAPPLQPAQGSGTSQIPGYGFGGKPR